jgi:hypothetical protein
MMLDENRIARWLDASSWQARKAQLDGLAPP